MKTLKIATRGSALALWQANFVVAEIAKTASDVKCELVVIKTTGDMILDKPLAEVGGKALFVKEIEEALLAGAADLAVHSMKDVPTEIIAGSKVSIISKRADPRDAWCSDYSMADFPEGGRIGTSSLRRAAQLNAHFRTIGKTIKIVPLRGNVPTRLEKRKAGDYDAVILAAAGLKRLGLENEIRESIAPSICLPAVGQGVLGLQVRAEDSETEELLRLAMHCEISAECVQVERAFLGTLEGSCRTPIAAYATVLGDTITLEGLVASLDGSVIIREKKSAPVGSSESLGIELGESCIARGAKAIIAACLPVGE